MADITAGLDPDKLRLTLSVKGEVKALSAIPHIDSDFYGHPVTGDRVAGPFTDLMTNATERSIDPR